MNKDFKPIPKDYGPIVACANCETELILPGVQISAYRQTDYVVASAYVQYACPSCGQAVGFYPEPFKFEGKPL